MSEVKKPQYYIGTVVSIDKDDDKLKNEREYHEIIVDIPGVIQGVKAFPRSCQLDEPKEGDQVLILSLDPVYNSYFLYEKLDENDYIGFRASGKMIDITPGKIVIGVFDENCDDYGNDEHWDTEGGKINDKQIASIIIRDNGNIEIDNTFDPDPDKNGDLNIKIKGNATIEVDKKIEITSSHDNIEIKATSGNVNVEASGNCTVKGANVDVKASGNCTIDSPNTTIKGGTVTLGSASGIPLSTPGFCSIPNCIFSGAPHINSTALTTP